MKNDNFKLIVGLGNPGEEYESTRHNAGAMFLDYLANKYGLSAFKPDKYSDALITTGVKNIPGEQTETLLFVFPQTFMNESGRSVKYLADKNGIKPENILVVHDDKDIPLGELKLQKGISSAGHKGVQSVIDQTKTNGFWRLRIGIGPVPEGVSTDTFVLQKFTKEETIKIGEIFNEAERRINSLISN